MFSSYSSFIALWLKVNCRHSILTCLEVPSLYIGKIRRVLTKFFVKFSKCFGYGNHSIMRQQLQQLTHSLTVYMSCGLGNTGRQWLVSSMSNMLCRLTKLRAEPLPLVAYSYFEIVTVLSPTRIL